MRARTLVAVLDAIDLAHTFARALQIRIGSESLAAVVARNRRYTARGDRWTCASTEHCDSNALMAKAWLETFGDAVPLDADGIPARAGDKEIWNRAWDIARSAEFKPEDRTSKEMTR